MADPPLQHSGSVSVREIAWMKQMGEYVLYAINYIKT